jgi:Cation-independent mannose-6-phosphate receptor repeat
MSFYILSFFLISLLTLSHSSTLGTFSASKCLWTDPSGVEYDLSLLKRTDFWKVKDGNGDSGLFAMDYLFNFCQTVSQKCKNQYVGAYEVNLIN